MNDGLLQHAGSSRYTSVDTLDLAMVICQLSANHIIYQYTQTKTVESVVKIIPPTNNRKQDVAQRAVMLTETRLMSASPGVPAYPTAWSLVLASGLSRLRT